MLDDETLASMYAERGVPTEWIETTQELMAPAFRTWFRALPSPMSNQPGHEDAELLVHDPIQALRKGGIAVDDDAHVATMVVNHEKTLCRFIMYASAVVSANPHTVGITIWKEEAPDDKGCPDDQEQPQE
jgi:hypothetical protein